MYRHLCAIGQIGGLGTESGFDCALPVAECAVTRHTVGKKNTAPTRICIGRIEYIVWHIHGGVFLQQRFGIVWKGQIGAEDGKTSDKPKNTFNFLFTTTFHRANSLMTCAATAGVCSGLGSKPCVRTPHKTTSSGKCPRRFATARKSCRPTWHGESLGPRKVGSLD